MSPKIEKENNATKLQFLEQNNSEKTKEIKRIILIKLKQKITLDLANGKQPNWRTIKKYLLKRFDKEFVNLPDNNPFKQKMIQIIQGHSQPQPQGETKRGGR